MRLLSLLLLGLLYTPILAQPSAPELSPAEIALAQQHLDAVLATAREPAFRQVLAGVAVTRDPTVDSLAIYDIAVRYDPERYNTPYNGRYPLDFSDQFIYWGKRLAIYTRSVGWRGGRFFLHNIASGRRAWISVWDTQQLYPSGRSTPSEDPNAEAWLRPYQAVDASTPIPQLGQWLSRMHQGGRDALYFRATIPSAPGELPSESQP
jgi:hypothetical protein